MDREKALLFLPHTYILSSSTVGLLLHLQYYQRSEPIIFKMWVKSKFVLWQPRCCNLLTEKKDKKFTLLKCSCFWKRTVTVNLKKFSLSTILRWYTFWKFYIVKLNYSSGRPNKVLKVIITMFYFCYSKNSSNITKIVFNSISIYSWKKISFSTNKKLMCYTLFL